MNIQLLSQLIRRPADVVDRATSEYGRLIPTLLAVTIVCGAFFGLTIGSHHSARQAVFAAIKMPMVFLIPALLAGTATHSLCGVVQAPSSFRRSAIAGLVTMTRVSVLVVAVAPVHWLLCEVVGNYRFTALTTAGVLSVAGLFGLPALAQVLPSSVHTRGLARLTVLLGAMALYGATTAQAGWLLRPFILRPHLAAGLFQPPESDIFTELGSRLSGREQR